MLMQPFVENAIWHGLMHANNDGLQRIEVTQQDKVLRCVVEDNGIGRVRSKGLNSKSVSYKKSVGMDITRNRLKLLYDNGTPHEFLQITDLYDEQGNGRGTKVQMDIPLKFSDDLVNSENSTI
jgi:LytS/YehU family sensor histidine kinase